jgi:hypothetical protein
MFGELFGHASLSKVMGWMPGPISQAARQPPTLMDAPSYPNLEILFLGRLSGTLSSRLGYALRLVSSLSRNSFLLFRIKAHSYAN